MPVDDVMILGNESGGITIVLCILDDGLLKTKSINDLFDLIVNRHDCLFRYLVKLSSVRSPPTRSPLKICP